MKRDARLAEVHGKGSGDEDNNGARATLRQQQNQVVIDRELLLLKYNFKNHYGSKSTSVETKMSQRKASEPLFRQRNYSEASGPSITVTSSEDTLETAVAKEGEEAEEVEHFTQRKHSRRFLLYLPYDPVWESFVMILIMLDLFFLSLVVTQEFLDEEDKRNLLCEFGTC